MRKIYLKPKDRSGKKYAGNTSGVCVVFVFASVILSMVLLTQSVRSEEMKESLRAEELSGIRSSMLQIASDLDSGAIGRARAESLYLRGSGVLGAVTADNRRKIYKFLSDISKAEPADYNEYAAFARKCAHCVQKELSGDEFKLDELNPQEPSTPNLSAGNAIGIAKSNSLGILYPGHLYDNDHVSVFGWNYYKKLEFSDLREYVFLGGREGERDDFLYDVDSLKKKASLHIFRDVAKSGEFKHLFCDMGIVFFESSYENFDIILGLEGEDGTIILYRAQDRVTKEE